MAHKFHVLSGILLSLLLFSSCFENEDVKPTAYGDVIVKSIIRNDTVVYGINYFAYSYTQMDSVTANRYGEDKKVTLDSLEYRYTFSFMPEYSDYSAVKPQKGNFVFNVAFKDNESYTATDYLDSTFLNPPSIRKLSFDNENEQFKIEWYSYTKADAYRIILVDEKNEIAFQSEMLYPNVTFFLVEANSAGWIKDKHPEKGKSFKVVLSAYLYESTPSSFDLQSISINDTASVSWLQ